MPSSLRDSSAHFFLHVVSRYTSQLHRKAAALGRDHLKLQREEGGATKSAAVIGVLDRWNQEATDAAGKVKDNVVHGVPCFRSRRTALLLVRVQEISALHLT